MEADSRNPEDTLPSGCDCPHCAPDLVSPITRRTLLGAFVGFGLISGSGSADAHLRQPRPMSGVRAIELINFNTGERWGGTFWRDGRHVDEAVRAISHLMRDHRTGSVRRVDTRLLDTLWLVRRRLGSSEPWRILSGFRAPATHAALRRSDSTAARRSFHVEGRALDAALADRTATAISRAARREGRGGVGLYARRGFVHLDTGPARFWSL